jgi:hypothetical protein
MTGRAGPEAKRTAPAERVSVAAALELELREVPAPVRSVTREAAARPEPAATTDKLAAATQVQAGIPAATHHPAAIAA